MNSIDVLTAAKELVRDFHVPMKERADMITAICKVAYAHAATIKGKKS